LLAQAARPIHVRIDFLVMVYVLAVVNRGVLDFINGVVNFVNGFLFLFASPPPKCARASRKSERAWRYA
jgi:hypothetical protein